MTRRRVPSWSAVLLAVLAIVWAYPVLWTLSNALKTTADLYRGPFDLPWPPAIGNIGAAWARANLGGALLNSAYVTSLTVAGVLALALPAAFSLTRLRPPGRALLLLAVLAPLIIPTEVLIVPLFSIYRSLGLINSLPGVALVNVVSSVSFATVILGAYVRRIPQDVIDAARVDGASQLAVLLRIVVPLARPGIVAVAVLVGVFAWNDFSGALVLLQKPSAFTAPLALTTFSTFYATDEGLKFAGLAIVFLPPLVLFLVVQRRFVQGLTVGVRGGWRSPRSSRRSSIRRAARAASWPATGSSTACAAGPPARSRSCRRRRGSASRR
jgi:ABC-type glycerol-3-phosphate transport system permease component